MKTTLHLTSNIYTVISHYDITFFLLFFVISTVSSMPRRCSNFHLVVFPDLDVQVVRRQNCADRETRANSYDEVL